jgi:hypothetical protein
LVLTVTDWRLGKTRKHLRDQLASIKHPSVVQEELVLATSVYPALFEADSMQCFFYETAGVVKVFVVVFAFVFSLVAFLLLLLSFVFLDSSQASIRTRCEPLWARCLMGPDKDEFGAAI